MKKRSRVRLPRNHQLYIRYVFQALSLLWSVTELDKYIYIYIAIATRTEHMITNVLSDPSIS